MNNKLKYFVVSDVHSFYDEMIEALNQAGYDAKNKSHRLIVNGDVFDRGPDSLKMYRFLKGIPKSRKILIKGNHEDLFLSLLEKDFPAQHDFNNGTVDAFLQLANEPSSTKEYLEMEMFFSLYSLGSFDLKSDTHIKKVWKNIVKRVRATGVVEWLTSDEWLTHYELENLIFTHAFIPLRKIENENTTGVNHSYVEGFEYISNWRKEASDLEWSESRWGCPWLLYQAGLFRSEEDNEKTLVVGHWHVADFHKYLGNNEETIRRDIYFSKGIIALDGGVRIIGEKYSYDCNVLVIDNGKLYDKYGKEFKLGEEE